MIAKKHLLLVAVGAWVLGLSVLGSEKNRVERPFKAHAQGVGYFTLDQGGAIVGAETFSKGQATHIGLITTHAVGEGPGGLPLYGTMTAQNGEQLFWMAPDPYTMIFTGGTGRFEGATGTIMATEMEMVFRPDPPPGTMIVDIITSLEGTITY